MNIESKSYPFLGIAHHYSIDYGVVLAYADALRKNMRQRSGAEMGARLDPWEIRACEDMFATGNMELRTRIRTAVLEMLRQKGET